MRRRRQATNSRKSTGWHRHPFRGRAKEQDIWWSREGTREQPPRHTASHVGTGARNRLCPLRWCVSTAACGNVRRAEGSRMNCWNRLPRLAPRTGPPRKRNCWELTKIKPERDNRAEGTALKQKRGEEQPPSKLSEYRFEHSKNLNSRISHRPCFLL